MSSDVFPRLSTTPSVSSQLHLAYNAFTPQHRLRLLPWADLNGGSALGRFSIHRSRNTRPRSLWNPAPLPQDAQKSLVSGHFVVVGLLRVSRFRQISVSLLVSHVRLRLAVSWVLSMSCVGATRCSGSRSSATSSRVPVGHVLEKGIF
jgi:hypothetical protein